MKIYVLYGDTGVVPGRRGRHMVAHGGIRWRMAWLIGLREAASRPSLRWGSVRDAWHWVVYFEVVRA